MKRPAGIRLAGLLLVLLAVGIPLWFAQRERRFNTPILQAARHYGVEAALVKAIVWRESRFDPRVVGRAGEIGLMQVTEYAAVEWAEASGIKDFTTNVLFDPFTNTLAGTFYLAKALKRYGGTDQPEAFALADYNAGRSRVLRWMKDVAATNSAAFLAQIDFPTTRAYVEAVLRQRDHYRPAFPSSETTPVNAGQK